jgi:hypothetical protein
MEEFVQAADIPNSLREALLKSLASYSVGFLRIEDKGRPDAFDASLVGSGTLVKIGNIHAILTAHHVLRALPRSGRLGIMLSRTSHPNTIDSQGLAFLEIARGANDASGPDLGAIILAPPISGAIAAKKTFYNLESRRDLLLHNPPDLRDGLWWVHGFLDERTVVADDPIEQGLTKFFYSFGLEGRPEPAIQVGEHDYYSFPFSHAAPKSFGGMSGGGLWQVPLKRDGEGKLTYTTPILSGVLFYQVATTPTQCGVKCHGRISVYQVAFNSIARNGVSARGTV